MGSDGRASEKQENGAPDGSHATSAAMARSLINDVREKAGQIS
jgi:hypothetical protein